jgi:hypothetical protein
MRALCEDCIFSKHTTHPFNNSILPEAGTLDCVYNNIWGLAPVQSAGEAKYFMLLINSATSYHQVYFLSSKSADITLAVFKEYHCELEQQTGRKLKRVHLDMGRGWNNHLWNQYIKEHSILLDFTTPYAHQQNGKAKHSMHMLLNMAHLMLTDSGPASKYWANAVQTAIYTHNFLPASCHPNKIPAELWLGQCQDISHLCPFGLTAYACIPVEVGSSKLSPHSTKLVFIGYFDHTGYKLLDHASGAVHKSRDIIFEESLPHFPTDPLMTP